MVVSHKWVLSLAFAFLQIELTLTPCIALFNIDSDMGTIGIWKLDGNPGYQSLMQLALNSDSFDDTAVALVVDMSRPWTMMSELEAWLADLPSPSVLAHTPVVCCIADLAAGVDCARGVAVACNRRGSCSS